MGRRKYIKRQIEQRKKLIGKGMDKKTDRLSEKENGRRKKE